MENINGISKKILYLIAESGVKKSEIIKAYKKNDCNIIRTLDSEVFKNKNLTLNIKKDKNINTLIKDIKKNKIRLLNISDKYYPKLLKEIFCPPLLLFYKGNQINKSSYFIAVVGIRKCSVYGRDVARYMSSQISKIGITVVSGMASGIDYWVQKSALEEKGSSIGVLGCGVDIIYPPENKNLYNELIEKGSILTEFLPGTPPLKSNFPSRNRIISGISMGVLVIEAGLKSGALITGDFALNQNREVFAIPGSIFNSESQGCNRLIKNGAKLVDNVDDILEEISQYYKKEFSGSATNEDKQCILRQNNDADTIIKTLNENQRKVFNCMGCLPKSIEKIVSETRFRVSEVLQILSELEVKELIKERKYNSYVRIVH